MIKRVGLFVVAFLFFILPVAAQEQQEARRDAASDMLSAGLSAYTKGDFVTAIVINSQLLRDNPAFPDALFNRGLAYAARKQFPEAERDFTAYCRLTPDVMFGYLERGRARRASGRLKSALADFSLIVAHKNPYLSSKPNPLTQMDLSGEACLERATTQYLIGMSSEVSGRGRIAAYETALAGFDTALAKPWLRVELTPNAVFNRAFIAEAQAADPLATPVDLADARYEAAAAGYEAYLQFVPKAPDARAVREHAAQVYAWLSGDKAAPRPTAPSGFALKPLP